MLLAAAAAGLLLSAYPPGQRATRGSIGEILSSATFAAAHEATYLHLRAAINVAPLQTVDERVFKRLDTRSAQSVLTYRDGEP